MAPPPREPVMKLDVRINRVKHSTRPNFLKDLIWPKGWFIDGHKYNKKAKESRKNWLIRSKIEDGREAPWRPCNVYLECIYCIHCIFGIYIYYIYCIPEIYIYFIKCIPRMYALYILYIILYTWNVYIVYNCLYIVYLEYIYIVYIYCIPGMYILYILYLPEMIYY